MFTQKQSAKTGGSVLNWKYDFEKLDFGPDSIRFLYHICACDPGVLTEQVSLQAYTHESSD